MAFGREGESRRSAPGESFKGEAYARQASRGGENGEKPP